MFCTECGSACQTHHKFCNVCGNALKEGNKNPSADAMVGNGQQERILFHLIGGLQFSGKDGGTVHHELYLEAAGKNILEIFISRSRIIVTPPTKSPKGTPAAQVLKDYLLGGDPNSKITSHNMHMCAIWQVKNTKFSMDEQMDEFDILGGVWITRAHMSGPCDFMGGKLEAGVTISIGGRVNNIPLREKATSAIEIARIFRFDTRNIKRRSYWSG